jgi:hypothetical protein
VGELLPETLDESLDTGRDVREHDLFSTSLGTLNGFYLHYMKFLKACPVIITSNKRKV